MNLDATDFFAPRHIGPGPDETRAMLENEISTLENAANPLERGSEDRVRRLAYLKRQRRGLVDAEQRVLRLRANGEKNARDRECEGEPGCKPEGRAASAAVTMHDA